MEMTKGGADVSVDALGISATCVDAILSLRKFGRHVQIGITTKQEAGYISIPIDQIVYKEIKLIGCHGMPAHRLSSMMPLIVEGRLTPGKMLNDEISLSQVEAVFESMNAAGYHRELVVELG